MQTKLDMFIDNKKNRSNTDKKPKDHHDSSRQNSQTEPIEPREEKVNKALIQYNRKALTCMNFFLLCPSDQIYFDKIENKLRELKKNYNPTKRSIFLKYVEKNLSFHSKFFNVENLKQINDETFWKDTLPKMITYFLDNHKQVKNSIQTLVLAKNKTSIITRGKALIILISLFFGIMPKTPLTTTRSFGQFMTKRPEQNNPEVRLQKLKFIINYFNIVIQKIYQSEEESNFEYESITFQKCVSKTVDVRNDLNTQNYDGKNAPLMEVEFVEDETVKIQDSYGNAAMVDFAHSCIGGGALRKGCVQEEILFLMFPQAYVSIFLVPEMKDNEAIAIYGLRKYSKYINYSYNVKFDGPQEKDKLNDVNSSVMIAIDATNYKGNHDPDYQFSKQNTLREMVKAITGFNAISESGFNELSQMRICTGRWGCGVFQGDQIWKFFIQWIACSYNYKNMIYTSDHKQIVSELKDTVERLVSNGKTVLDLFAMMEEFIKVKQRINKPPQDATFIDFIKSNYIL